MLMESVEGIKGHILVNSLVKLVILYGIHGAEHSTEMDEVELV